MHEIIFHYELFEPILPVLKMFTGDILENKISFVISFLELYVWLQESRDWNNI